MSITVRVSGLSHWGFSYSDAVEWGREKMKGMLSLIWRLHQWSRSGWRAVTPWRPGRVWEPGERAGDTVWTSMASGGTRGIVSPPSNHPIACLCLWRLGGRGHIWLGEWGWTLSRGVTAFKFGSNGKVLLVHSGWLHLLFWRLRIWSMKPKMK